MGPATFFIGWDVGGWNCDKNARSRDAIVILDDSLQIVGQPWRGNLQTSINQAATTADWLGALFSLCGADSPPQPFRAVLAIDTPLGFSQAFVKLVSHRQWTEPSSTSAQNPYLYRQTERYLFQRGRRPLSPVKDMIGSQATKGMHVLAKFAPIVESCGVWTDGATLRAIEAYPSASRGSARVRSLLAGRRLPDADRQDALVCALIAYLFISERPYLESPPADVSPEEGWVWFPKD